MTLPRLLSLILLTAALGGCSASKPLAPTFSVEAGRYGEAFDAAREVLRAARFDVDRVDAGAGVISTEPKPSAGFATPWDREQATMGQRFEDMFNHQQRIVRITFESASEEPRPEGQSQLGEAFEAPDLRRHQGPLVARVQVVIEREHRPGWRVESVSIGSSSFTRDPALGPRGMSGSYWVPVARDPRLEGRLAARVAERLNAGQTEALRPAAPEGG